MTSAARWLWALMGTLAVGAALNAWDGANRRSGGLATDPAVRRALDFARKLGAGHHPRSDSAVRDSGASFGEAMRAAAYAQSMRAVGPHERSHR